MSLIEVEKDCKNWSVIGDDYVVILHFDEIVHHGLLIHNHKYTNEMVHQAHNEWNIAHEQKKAKIAMMSNMKKGLMNLINKQKQ